MLPERRKVVTLDEDIYGEGEKAAQLLPVRVTGDAGVFSNPLAGNGYVQDLTSDINGVAPLLGKLLTERLIALAGSAEAIEADGKACISGEILTGSIPLH